MLQKDNRLISARMNNEYRIRVEFIGRVKHPCELDLVPPPADQRAYCRFVCPGKMTGKMRKKRWAKIDPVVAKSMATRRVGFYRQIDNRLRMLDRVIGKLQS